jgi:hypothetical protein
MLRQTLRMKDELTRSLKCGLQNVGQTSRKCFIQSCKLCDRHKKSRNGRNENFWFIIIL